MRRFQRLADAMGETLESIYNMQVRGQLLLLRFNLRSASKEARIYGMTE